MTDRDLFIAALSHGDPDERQAYLQEACGADSAAAAACRSPLEGLRERRELSRISCPLAASLG